MKKKTRTILLCCLCFCFATNVLIRLFPGFLSISLYELPVPLQSTIRIVQLSDLHNAEFGEGNSHLIEMVREQSPDLIVMTGDMLNRDDPNLSIVETVISGLAEIAPVYYGYGNHETAWEKREGKILHAEFAEAGAVVLDNEYIDVEIKGNKLRIGGYMGFYWQPHMMTVDPEQQEFEREFYRSFEDTERYKILLNHIPTQWIDWEYVNLCPVDLVFCGHYHGGVIRIPFTDQGVFAPYVGWFPRFTKGMDVGICSTCVLSVGLGSEHLVPRINNPPEIVVLDLVPET